MELGLSKNGREIKNSVDPYATLYTTSITLTPCFLTFFRKQLDLLDFEPSDECIGVWCIGVTPLCVYFYFLVIFICIYIYIPFEAVNMIQFSNLRVVSITANTELYVLFKKNNGKNCSY